MHQNTKVGIFSDCDTLSCVYRRKYKKIVNIFKEYARLNMFLLYRQTLLPATYHFNGVLSFTPETQHFLTVRNLALPLSVDSTNENGIMFKRKCTFAFIKLKLKYTIK